MKLVERCSMLICSAGLLAQTVGSTVMGCDGREYDLCEGRVPCSSWIGDGYCDDGALNSVNFNCGLHGASEQFKLRLVLRACLVRM